MKTAQFCAFVVMATMAEQVHQISFRVDKPRNVVLWLFTVNGRKFTFQTVVRDIENTHDTPKETAMRFAAACMERMRSSVKNGLILPGELN